MRTLIHFFGLKRSGNHAIIYWLTRSFGGCFNHENNILDIYEYPARFLLPKDLHIQPKSKEYLTVLSYEDFDLPLVPFIPTIKEEKSILPNSNGYQILSLRDPFNFFASRMKLIQEMKKKGVTNPIQNVSWQKVVDLWKMYAKEYLGETNFLKNKITINYNRWFLSKSYRDNIFKNIFNERENLDQGLDVVPPNGRGSSFNKMQYEGRGREMKVLNRWKYYKRNKLYRNFFKDKELVDLSKKIFGNIKGTERLFD